MADGHSRQTLSSALPALAAWPGGHRASSLQCPQTLRRGAEGRTGLSPAWQHPRTQPSVSRVKEEGGGDRSPSNARERDQAPPRLHPHAGGMAGRHRAGHFAVLSCSFLPSQGGGASARPGAGAGGGGDACKPHRAHVARLSPDPVSVIFKLLRWLQMGRFPVPFQGSPYILRTATRLASSLTRFYRRGRPRVRLTKGATPRQGLSRADAPCHQKSFNDLTPHNLTDGC